MDNTLQQLLEELKITTYNSRPNIKYQDQMDLIERLEKELEDYVKVYNEPTPKIEYILSADPITDNEPIIISSPRYSPPTEIETINEPVTDFEPNHITYPVENPVVIPKQKGRKPKPSQ